MSGTSIVVCPPCPLQRIRRISKRWKRHIIKQKMKNKQGGVFSPLLISELEERTILLYDYYAQA
jgi:hypothetical protein